MLDWSIVDTAMLDMDGTLLDLHYDNHFWLHHLPQHFAAVRGMSVAEAEAELKPRFARHQGSLNWYCVDFWSADLGIDIGSLKHETAHLIKPLPDTLAFLNALNASGRDAWLVTNAHHKSLNLKLDRTGIGRYFNRIICSHDYQAPKESPDFWQRLQEREPFDPARTLMIDDNIPVLQTAREYGLAQVLSIVQPDSRRPPRHDLPLPAIHRFADIMPIPARTC